ncbi:MAG TPA: VTT domain-containing protein [Stellaceae bacterium]|jgi:uncharacterized membrane protein YdjX (TVP38/TMEM64 family)|nr:VTT domain-containing protein [Stellaceae bacterium]
MTGKVGRIVMLALLVAGIVAAWRWRHLFGPLALTELIGREPAAPLVFIAMHIAGSLFFVPRLFLALGAGAVFGMWWGILWAALGSLAGAVAGFLAARYIRAGYVAPARLARSAGPARLAALVKRAEGGGWRSVALLRLVPVIPHSLTNYALGLTRVRLGAYAVGSLLGQLPMTIAYTDLGAAGEGALRGAADWPQAVLWPSLIGAAALTLSLLIPALVRRRLRPVA